MSQEKFTHQILSNGTQYTIVAESPERIRVESFERTPYGTRGHVMVLNPPELRAFESNLTSLADEVDPPLPAKLPPPPKAPKATP